MYFIRLENWDHLIISSLLIKFHLIFMEDFDSVFCFSLLCIKARSFPPLV